jgi:hypothetical protein
MRWEMGFSASEIASTAFSNPNIFRAVPLGPRFGCAFNGSAFGFIYMYQNDINKTSITELFFSYKKILDPPLLAQKMWRTLLYRLMDSTLTFLSVCVTTQSISADMCHDNTRAESSSSACAKWHTFPNTSFSFGARGTVQTRRGRLIKSSRSFIRWSINRSRFRFWNEEDNMM